MVLPSRKASVILDTNALLLFGQGVDVFSETERLLSAPFAFVIPETVMGEVERLSRKATRDGREAKLALMLVRERERRQRESIVARLLLPRAKEIPLKILPGSGEHHADDAILSIAEDEPAATIVVTLDRELQRRLLAKKVRVLGVRQGRLSFIEQ